MKVRIIDSVNEFPQFEAQNVFQTVEWMRLFEREEGTQVVLFAVYSVFNSRLLMVQPVTINRYYRYLPSKFASYAVAWREPWRVENLADKDAIEAFELMREEIVRYCRKRALYIEYRHFGESTINDAQWERKYRVLPWWNIYREFEAGEEVEKLMKRDKRRQLKQSLEAGVEVVLEPTTEQIVEWYGLLKRLYRRIHRPLPSVNVFLRLKELGIGRVFVVVYNGRIVSGSALLCCAIDDCRVFYEWYRASVDERIEGVYPSVVATWQALSLAAERGGRFDFMGAGPRDKTYGVRDFKLSFGGELTPEYRYRKLLLF